MSDTAAVFGAALAGAVVGGAATGIGSYFVGQTDRRHAARVSLYLDLLLELRVAPPWVRGDSGKRSRTDVTHDIVRIANVAGGRAVGLATAVREAVEARDRPSSDEEREAALSAPARSPERVIDRTAEAEACKRAIDNFDTWLERKVRAVRSLLAAEPLRPQMTRPPCGTPKASHRRGQPASADRMEEAVQRHGVECTRRLRRAHFSRDLGAGSS